MQGSERERETEKKQESFCIEEGIMHSTDG